MPTSPPRAKSKSLETRRDKEPVGLDSYDSSVEDVRRIIDMMNLPANISKAEANRRAYRATEILLSIKPADGLETMLGLQMMGTHEAALECLRQAASPNAHPMSRDMNLKQAGKLMSLYTTQLAALNKYRGIGQQKVVVEHVHVESGGQAIVGTVEAGDRHLDSTNNASIPMDNKEKPVAGTRKPRQRKKIAPPSE